MGGKKKNCRDSQPKSTLIVWDKKKRIETSQFKTIGKVLRLLSGGRRSEEIGTPFWRLICRSFLLKVERCYAVEWLLKILVSSQEKRRQQEIGGICLNLGAIVCEVKPNENKVATVETNCLKSEVR